MLIEGADEVIWLDEAKGLTEPLSLSVKAKSYLESTMAR